MKTKILMLVLHIMCAITFGLYAITATNTTTTILYAICSVLWDMNVVLDIVTFKK